MYELKIEDFNLDQIMGSGQCFRWKDAGNGRISITAYGKYMEAVQKGDVFVFSCGEDEFKNVWAEYFDMGTDYGRIKETADSSDTYLQEGLTDKSEGLMRSLSLKYLQQLKLWGLKGWDWDTGIST